MLLPCLRHDLEVITPDTGTLKPCAFCTDRFQFVTFDFAFSTCQAALGVLATCSDMG